MDAKAATVEALRAEWDRVRGSLRTAAARSAAVAYYRLRSEQRATQEQVAQELSLNRWTLAKWWQRSVREGAGSTGSVEECAALQQQISGLGPRTPSRRYPDELKRRIAGWAGGQRARGVGAVDIAKQLGVPWESVSRWMGLRSTESPPRQEFRPVEIISSGEKKATAALRSPNGFIVEGLDVDALAELLRRLG
jgi:transposase-like protein